MGDAHMAVQARLMSQALRKLTGAISKSKTCAIFINQLREKVGSYGGGETTPGGRALKFYATVRIDVRKQDYIKQGTENIGARVKAKIVKNKLAPPFKSAEFDIMFGKGISKEGGLLDVAVEFQIVEKSGSWFSFENEKIGQGRENAKIYFIEHPDVAKKIEKKVYEKLQYKKNEGNEIKDAKKEPELAATKAK